MKILHTADWHIGKVLHKHPLEADHALFFGWLLELIKEENIDLLLVSGDIFDLSNPAAKDRKVYYNFLRQLINLGVKAVITGGNHDAVGVLNAPKEVLDASEIYVVGGAQEDLTHELVEIKDQNQNLNLVVAAVPFLRDRDLRKNDGDHRHSSRIEAIRSGIRLHYQDLANICDERYKDVPIIAMGHLYARGVITSESERDIHIGNAAAVEADIFSPLFNYVALGHIHRPQVINKNEYIRYSGSPIPLSFSERQDQKVVLILDLQEGQLIPPRAVPVPQYRVLQKLAGTLKEVSEKLQNFANTSQLAALLEIEVSEDAFSPLTLAEVESLVSEYAASESMIILKSKTTFTTGTKTTADLFAEGANVEDLKPVEVFSRKLEAESVSDDHKKMLLGAFSELLESVQQAES